MKARHPLLPFVAIFVTTMLLSILWEFLLEGHVTGEWESARERWEYVITSSVFAGLALLAPAWWHVRSHRRQKAHETQLERTAAIVANTSEAVVTLNHEGRVDHLNPAFTHQTGYSTEDVIGVHWRKLIETVQGKPTLSLPGASHWRGELVVKRKHGPSFAAHATGNPLTNGNGTNAGYILAFSDISDMKRSEERLRHMAQHDGLTQLPNRRTFHTRMEEVLESAERHGHRAAVLFLDLDNFKHINDTLGHATGDALLKAVARRLASCMRSEDMIARISGDEFLIALSHIRDARSCVVVIDKLVETFLEPFTADETALRASASIGISVYPEDGRTVEDLIKHADIAMYAAKESGRGSYRFYEPGQGVAMREWMQLEQAVRRGLAAQEFELHYQPQYEIATRRLVGLEALVRWRHPERGLLFPKGFLSMAEDSGLIIPLGEQVMRLACDQARRWNLDRLEGVRMAVNVSARQMSGDGFLRFLDKLEGSSPPYREWLELELTESALMKKDQHTLRVLSEMRAKGIRLVLDDFGTGYSSFGYLNTFPLDKVKVDQSFISELGHPKSNGASLVRAMVAMSRELGLEVVAEGVETENQANVLRDVGCAFAQGCYFGPPAPPEEIGALLTGTSTVGLGT